MLHPEDQSKLQYVLDWVRGFSGDNVQNLGNTVYVGSGPQRQQPGMENWAPQQFRVKSEENDYLVCVPYDSQTETAGTKEYKVAKAPDHRGDTVRRGVYPRYVPEVSVIWAAPFRRNGAEDGDENPIVLMEVNLDARNAAWFPAKITASSSSSEDHTFVEVTAALADLTDGRTAENAKELNGGQGTPVGTYVTMLEIKQDEGDPEYYFQYQATTESAMTVQEYVVRIDNGATVPQIVTLSSENYGNRLVVARVVSETIFSYQSVDAHPGLNEPGTKKMTRVGKDNTDGDLVIWDAPSLSSQVFIDQSDGNSLKFKAADVPTGTSGDYTYHWIRIESGTFDPDIDFDLS